MTFSRRAKELMLVAALLALPVLLLRAHLKANSDLSFVDRSVLRVVAPLEALSTAVGRFGAHLWSRYAYLVHVAKDNESLRGENAQLTADLRRMKIEVARSTVLEKLLDLKRRVPAQTVAAHVIGVQTSAFFRVLRIRIDRGENEIKPGMPVLASAGVVGRIERVFGDYSDVLLAVDQKSAIDVVVPGTGVRGILKGVTAENSYRARIEYLERKDEVKEGDVVVTSGVGAFPRNLALGTIAKVTRRDFGLYQDAEVKPAVDFSRLSDVLIVTEEPPLALNFDGDPKLARATRGREQRQ